MPAPCTTLCDLRVLRGLIAAWPVAILTTGPLHADEGMWLLNKPSAAQLERDHGFQLQPAWLDHLQRASVWFGGTSGSFVSPDGLILTNHHVGLGTIHKLSSAEHDYTGPHHES